MAVCLKNLSCVKSTGESTPPWQPLSWCCPSQPGSSSREHREGPERGPLSLNPLQCLLPLIINLFLILLRDSQEKEYQF